MATVTLNKDLGELGYQDLTITYIKTKGFVVRIEDVVLHGSSILEIVPDSLITDLACEIASDEDL